jgi:hypothetical protein
MASQPEQLKSPAVDLAADEAIVQRWRANHTRGQIAVGGALWLTTQRLIFEPHRFESGVMGRSVWTCRLADVTDVGIAPRGCAPFTGAWRRRLAVRCGPAADFFVISRVENVAEAIRNAQAAQLDRPDPR